MKSKLSATALWMGSALMAGLVTVNQAFAGLVSVTPPPSTPSSPSVPEFDGPGAIAAIALLVSVGAIIYQKMKK